MARVVAGRGQVVAAGELRIVDVDVNVDDYGDAYAHPISPLYCSPMKIAIDGPAGSGKSTIGGALAQHFGFLYFDTGIMYRVVTLAALEENITLADEATVTALAQRIHIRVSQPTHDDGRQYTVWLDERDVTWLLRTAEVDRGVSTVSAYPDVRHEMVRQQRRMAEGGNIVMVGRDIGTVVLPEADLKIYLTASAEERARRRHKELQARSALASYEDILNSIQQRDTADSSRKASPLHPADDAIILDCTNKSIEQTVQAVLQLVQVRIS